MNEPCCSAMYERSTIKRPRLMFFQERTRLTAEILSVCVRTSDVERAAFFKKGNAIQIRAALPRVLGVSLRKLRQKNRKAANRARKHLERNVDKIMSMYGFVGWGGYQGVPRARSYEKAA